MQSSTMAPAGTSSVQTQFKALSSTARLDVLILDGGGDNTPKPSAEGSKDDPTRLSSRRNLYFGILTPSKAIISCSLTDR